MRQAPQTREPAPPRPPQLRALQARLSVGASQDPLEFEDDRVADQVLGAEALAERATAASLSIQRFAATGHPASDAAATGVERALAGAGRPLEPALRQDMEQRFGHDFARLPVHPSPARMLEIGDTADALPLDNAGAKAEAKPAEKKADPPACAEKINWKPNSPVPVEVMADNAADFASRIDAALAGTPHMSAVASWDSTVDGGKVSAVNLTLETTIIRPRYGGGRASDSQKKLIQRVVEFIKTHEEKHRDASRAVWQQAVCDALGKSTAEATKILEKARCVGEPQAQAAIDAVEGKIDWVMNQGGTEVVDFKPAGVKQNYKPDDCK